MIHALPSARRHRRLEKILSATDASEDLAVLCRQQSRGVPVTLRWQLVARARRGGQGSKVRPGAPIGWWLVRMESLLTLNKIYRTVWASGRRVEENAGFRYHC
jgi:hypothetical protein